MMQTSMVMLRSVCEHQDSTSNPQGLGLVDQVLLPPSHLLDSLIFSFFNVYLLIFTYKCLHDYVYITSMQVSVEASEPPELE